MKRVLFVSPTDEIGGADASLFELVRSLDRTTHESHVVVPHAGPWAARYRELGVPVHVVPVRKLKNTRDPRWHLGWLLRAPLRVWRLARLCRRLQPAVVHVNTSVDVLAGLAAARYCRRSGARLVWHVRELELRPRPVERLVFGMVQRLADEVIAISGPVAARVAHAERVHVIPNGLDLARFATARRVVPGAARTLGWVGRIAPGKGLEHVLTVFERVLRVRPGTRLVVMGAPVAGHEGFAEGLRARCARLGDATTWLPAGAATEIAYASMDLFLHLPDVAEGLGRTVLEAQATGVPVVAWPRGGLVDALQDGTSGRFAAAGDLDAATNCVLELLADDATRTAMGEAARTFVQQHFARERCARAVEAVYAESAP